VTFRTTYGHLALVSILPVLNCATRGQSEFTVHTRPSCATHGQYKIYYAQAAKLCNTQPMQNSLYTRVWPSCATRCKVIQHKLHIHTLRDWFKHYDLLEGHPCPYDLYGMTAQQIEVLQPGIFNRSVIGSSTTISSKATHAHTISMGRPLSGS
jgi:hypothetical protein